MIDEYNRLLHAERMGECQGKWGRDLLEQHGKDGSNLVTGTGGVTPILWRERKKVFRATYPFISAHRFIL